MRTKVDKMGGFSCLLVSLIGLLFCSSQVLCQNVTNDGGSTGDQDTSEGSRRPIEEGMEPLYQMTKIFLDLVQPVEKGNVIEIIDIDALFNNETGLSSVLEDYDSWARHYIGYAACVAAGLLFIVFMPLCGMCVCCCRLCGNCGGKTDPRDTRYSHCKRITLAIILVIINIFMFVGMVCAFVTNDLIREQLSGETDEGMISKVTANMRVLDTFKDDTFSQIRTDIVDEVEAEMEKLLLSLEAAPEKAQSELGEVTNSEDVLNAASDLAQSAMRINSSLTVVNERTVQLQNLQDTLSTELTAVQTSLTDNLDAITDCNDVCTTLKEQVNNLDQNADFNNVESVSEQLDKVRAVVDSDLVSLVNQGKSEFEKVVEKVTNDTRDEIEEIRSETRKILQDVRKNIDEMEAEVDNVVNFENLTRELETAEPLVDEYGTFFYYAGLGLSCLLLLIILFYLLGLLFGVFGEPPYDAAPTCNKGVGANLLLAAIGFTFIFSWLLMLVCLITFLAGGVTQTEFCRLPITATAGNSYTKGQLFDEVLGAASPDLGISVQDILKDCGENKGLLQLDSIKDFVNLDDLLDLDKFDVKDRITELSNVTVNLTDVDILSDDLDTQLTSLADAGLDDINFDSFRAELNKSLTTNNLMTLAGAVRTLADAGPAGSDPVALREDADTLESIHNGTVSNMMAQAESLSSALTELESDVKGGETASSFKAYTEQVRDALQQAEDDVHVNGSRIIQNFVTSLANETYEDFQNYADELTVTLQEDVGRCKPVSDVIISTLDIFCVDVLEPFNGFWFSMGWFLFFSVPAIILSFVLAGLYRKSEDYDRYNKTFDDPSYDAYNGVYPGDNIPLEDRGGAHKYGDRQGHHNTGYDGAGYQQQDYNYRGGARGGEEYYPAPPQNPPHYYNNRRY